MPFPQIIPCRTTSLFPGVLQCLRKHLKEMGSFKHEPIFSMGVEGCGGGGVWWESVVRKGCGGGGAYIKFVMHGALNDHTDCCLCAECMNDMCFTCIPTNTW